MIVGRDAHYTSEHTFKGKLFVAVHLVKVTSTDLYVLRTRPNIHQYLQLLSLRAVIKNGENVRHPGKLVYRALIDLR